MRSRFVGFGRGDKTKFNLFLLEVFTRGLMLRFPFSIGMCFLRQPQRAAAGATLFLETRDFRRQVFEITPQYEEPPLELLAWYRCKF